MSQQETLLTTLEKSITDNTFVRLTLSKNRDPKSDLKKAIFKLATIKKALHISTVFRHKTKDITKNFLLDKGLETIKQLLEQQFFIANLFTIKKDISLELSSQGKAKIREKKPTFSTLPARSHDKTKQRFITETHYLKALGVLDAKGRIQKDKGDKLSLIHISEPTRPY